MTGIRTLAEVVAEGRLHLRPDPGAERLAAGFDSFLRLLRDARGQGAPPESPRPAVAPANLRYEITWIREADRALLGPPGSE